jgi:hypothetical protein
MRERAEPGIRGGEAMEREEPIKRLKGVDQGIAEWIRRRESQEESPKLSDVNLSGAGLGDTNLSGACLGDTSGDEVWGPGARRGVRSHSSILGTLSVS